MSGPMRFAVAAVVVAMGLAGCGGGSTVDAGDDAAEAGGGCPSAPAEPGTACAAAYEGMHCPGTFAATCGGAFERQYSTCIAGRWVADAVACDGGAD